MHRNPAGCRPQKQAQVQVRGCPCSSGQRLESRRVRVRECAHLQAVLEQLLGLAVGVAKQLDDHDVVLVVLGDFLQVVDVQRSWATTGA